MKHNRKIIYLAGFLFSISLALTSYINSSFLENYIDQYYIGILYILASIITIWGLSELPKILNRWGNRSTVLFLSSLTLISLIVLSLTQNAIWAVGAFIVYFASFNFIFFSGDIFLEDLSKNSRTGSVRGIYLTIINSAWIVAQVISGSVIAKSSFSGIYLLATLFMFLAIVLIFLLLRNFKDPVYKKVPTFKTVRAFINNKHLSRIYLISLILKIFYAWMIIYTPIYLHEYLGFAWNQIGVIFGIMLLPFVILDFPLGKLSDKIGEKKMLLVGFCIIAVATLTIPLIKIPTLYFWASILFLTRVGAAIIEIMSESYFFKIINKEDANLVSFFRNTSPISFIIGPVLALPVIFFVPSFEYLFYVLGAIMLVGLLISLRLREVR